MGAGNADIAAPLNSLILDEAKIMTKLLGVLALILICVGVGGYFLGWFSFSSESTQKDATINVTVNKEKVKQDEEKAKEAIRSAGQKIKEEVQSLKKN
jgi:hypothetical protein